MVSATRVVLWGLGAMGQGIARALLGRTGVEVVGALDTSPEKAGRDLGEVVGSGRPTGVRVSNVPEEVLDRAGADLVIIATTSFLRDLLPQVRRSLEAGANVISIGEEMAYPWVEDPDRARELDRLARAQGYTVLGTGINPGFVLDTLIIALTGACLEVKRIHALRVNDLSPFGPTVMRTQGVGTTPQDFRKGLVEGTVVGHIGFPQSIHLIAKALGWRIERIDQEREPIISKTYRRTPYVNVAPGEVAGCRHTARAYVNGREAIVLEHPQQVLPGTEGVETGDFIRIEGTPSINLRIQPEIPGGTGTIALAVNMIPLVISAGPGLVTMADLPVPRAVLDYMGLKEPVRGQPRKP